MQTEELKPLNEGKTKIIYPIVGDPNLVRIKSKDDITAGDGDKHDLIAGKAVLATETTCNVFALLRNSGVPVAFVERTAPDEFIAEKMNMLPYEVVVRREAHGSFLERFPHLEKGHVFPALKVEVFAKTSGLKWRDKSILMDDPLLRFDPHDVLFLLPHFTKEQKLKSKETGERGFLVGQKPFMVVPNSVFFQNKDTEVSRLKRLQGMAAQTFLVLEKAWALLGRKLVDFKIEGGVTSKGELLIADVIDNDSWRIVDSHGAYEDKQVYRDGGDLNEVTRKYERVAELTKRFELPQSRIIIWCGSPSDDTAAFVDAIGKLLPAYGVTVEYDVVACSAHKQPALAYAKLQRLLQDNPETVIIANIGRSNGAGPTLSANCTVPVITVPANFNEFPEDVWSSLRTPSNVPVMTVVEPSNAVLAALQILAMRNSAIYAALRMLQEQRLTDI